MLLLFLLGLAVGSFLNVVALRYHAGGPARIASQSVAGGRLFTPDIVGGRSHCPYCDKTLRWYELIPFFSFVLQLGRCRHCRHTLSWQYPIVELLTGFALVGVALYAVPAVIWGFAVLALILIALIDLRLSIIPDQLNWFLVLLGLALIVYRGVGDFAVWQEGLIGLVFGIALFGAVILLSRGKGMGLGDLKMAGALGFLFGWPKIVLAAMASFIIGAFWALPLIALGKKRLKETIPFGPFLAAGAFLALFFGEVILRTYLSGL